MMNAVFTTLMALAPVIGGFVNTLVGWRGNYTVVAGICLLSWLILFFFLPETLKKMKKIKVQEIVSDYKRLLKSLNFMIAANVPSLLYGSYMSFITISPFIYMDIMSLSILNYTIHTAFVVACFAMMSFLSGKITDLLGTRNTLILALFIQLLGAMFMCFSQKVLCFTLSMSLFSIGFALIYPIVFARSMEIFPNIKGTASSAIMSLRYFICAALTFLCGQTFDGSISSLSVTLLSVSVFITGLSLLMLKDKVL
jgi:DHA1 family bicyclomycin/chloramphenicol resistance-like MFS transporter